MNHLAKRISEEWLTGAFGSFGEIKSLHPKDGGRENYAFINYYSLEAAEKAVRGMDGTEVDGLRLQVKLQQQGINQKKPSFSAEIEHAVMHPHTLTTHTLPTHTRPTHTLTTHTHATYTLPSQSTNLDSAKAADRNKTLCGEPGNPPSSSQETTTQSSSESIASVSFALPQSSSESIASVSFALPQSSSESIASVSFALPQTPPKQSIFQPQQLRDGIEINPKSATTLFSLEHLAQPTSTSSTQPSITSSVVDSKVVSKLSPASRPWSSHKITSDVSIKSKNVSPPKGNIVDVGSCITAKTTAVTHTNTSTSPVKTPQCPGSDPLYVTAKTTTHTGISPAKTPGSKSKDQPNPFLQAVPKCVTVKEVVQLPVKPMSQPAESSRKHRHTERFRKQAVDRPMEGSRKQAMDRPTEGSRKPAMSQPAEGSRKQAMDRPMEGYRKPAVSQFPVKVQEVMRFPDSLTRRILLSKYGDEIKITHKVSIEESDGNITISGERTDIHPVLKKLQMLSSQIEQNMKTQPFSLHCLYAPAFANPKLMEDVRTIEQKHSVTFSVATQSGVPMSIQDFAMKHFESINEPTEITQLSDVIITKPEFLWSATNASGQYHALDPEVSNVLNALYSSGEKHFTHNSIKYTVDFSTMTLTDMSTGRRGSIHPEPPTWRYYKDDDFGWVPYEAEENHTIEKMLHCGSPTELKVGGTLCTIDFEKMCQIDLETGATVQLKRMPPPKSSEPYDHELTLQVRGLGATFPFAVSELRSKLDEYTDSLDYKLPPQATDTFEKYLLNYARKYCIGVKSMRDMQRKVELKGASGFPEKVKIKIMELFLEFQQQLPHQPTPTLPEYWEPQKEPCELKLVNQGSDEWNHILARMRESMPSVQLKRVERIQNLKLWNKYDFFREQMRKDNDGKVNEMPLFHGTRDKPPEEIFTSDKGFDFRFSPSGLWGRGAYFAVKASYSDRGYAHKTNGSRQLLLARVLTGNYVQLNPDKTLTMPPLMPQDGNEAASKRYDTVTGHTNGSRIYVTYDHEKAYPAYLITYET